MDNSAIVGAFDLKTGKRLWTKTLGTLQKGSPVLADGKLYVGTENGKFFILKPVGDRCRGAGRGRARHRRRLLKPIVASPIVADGRVYVTSMDNLYAIGRRKAGATGPAPTRDAAILRAGRPSVQVFPYDALVAPGGKQTVHARGCSMRRATFIRRSPRRRHVDGRSG